MNSPDSPQPMDKEQARRRREELQKANMLQQARRIAEQREMSARQKSAQAKGVPLAAEKPLSARSTFTPAAQPPAPRPQPPAATREPARAPVAPPAPAARPESPSPSLTRSELDDMRAEMMEFAHETTPVPLPAEEQPRPAAQAGPVAKPRPAAPPAPEPNISAEDLEIDSPNLELAAAIPLPPPPSEPAALEIDAENLTIVSPGGKITTSLGSLPAEPPGRPATLKLKLVESADMHCPKCGWLIPDAQRGAYYTECRRCGEIIKSSAA